MTTLIIVTRAEGDERKEEEEDLEDGKVPGEGEVWMKKTKKCPVLNAREVVLNYLALAIDFSERKGYGGGGGGAGEREGAMVRYVKMI